MLLLTPQDGTQNIITTAQEMCHSVMQGKLKTNEIDTKMVNKRLSGKDLLVVDYRGLLGGGGEGNTCCGWKGGCGMCPSHKEEWYDNKFGCLKPWPFVIYYCGLEKSLMRFCSTLQNNLQNDEN